MASAGAQHVVEGAEVAVAALRKVDVVRIRPVQVVLDDLVPRIAGARLDQQLRVQARLLRLQQARPRRQHPHLIHTQTEILYSVSFSNPLIGRQQHRSVQKPTS